MHNTIYFAQTVMLLTYIREKHDSTLGHDIDYPDVFGVFPQSLQAHAGDSTFKQTRTVSFQILSNTSFINPPIISKLFLWSYGKES
jgi:hypothetical protein